MKPLLCLPLLVIAIVSVGLLEDAFPQTWARTFGGIYDEEAYSIVETKDKNLIVAGNTNSFGSANGDIFLIKIDPAGNILWQKTYGDDSFDTVWSVNSTSDRGCIVLGMKLNACCTDLWILKLDEFGNIDWQKTYGGVEYEQPGSIQQTKDSGYIFDGTTGSFGINSDIWVIRLDTQGNIVWQKAYGTSGYEAAYSVFATKKNAYIVAGMISGSNGTQDALVFKLDSSGDVLWSKSFISLGDEALNSVDGAPGGNFIGLGQTRSIGASVVNFWAVKLNRRGKMLWQKTYGGADVNLGRSIKRTSDDGYAFVGYTDSSTTGANISFVKLDSDGHAAMQKNFGGSQVEDVFSIASTSDGGYAVAGFTRSFGIGNADLWVLKLDSSGGISDSCIYESETAIIETDSMMDTSNIPLSVTPTSVTAIDTSVIPADTSAPTDVQCSN